MVTTTQLPHLAKLEDGSFLCRHGTFHWHCFRAGKHECVDCRKTFSPKPDYRGQLCPACMFIRGTAGEAIRAVSGWRCPECYVKAVYGD